MRTDLSTESGASVSAELLQPPAHTTEAECARAYDPAKGIVRRVTKRAISGQPNRTKLNPERFLIRPYALAGSPRELLIAGLCIILLGAILVGEILTPDVVLGAFGILPLLAAIWVLSNRLAALVAIAATLFIGLAAAIETTNRITVVLIGVAVLLTALVARLHATAIASLLSSRRHRRPTITSWAARAKLDGIDRSPYGLPSLTRRELEVARLGAEGYTAHEIGQLLKIGDRTVESHLGSAYSKLRIRSRLQLIRMASRLGAPPVA